MDAPRSALIQEGLLTKNGPENGEGGLWKEAYEGGPGAKVKG